MNIKFYSLLEYFIQYDHNFPPLSYYILYAKCYEPLGREYCNAIEFTT